MRTMYDAVTPANIPGNAQLVGGYVNGRYAWKPSDWARFPHARPVYISVFATGGGDVLDVENGDATPDQAVAWVRARRAAGAVPSVYCNASTWPSVRAAFAQAREPEPYYWIAQYDGNPAIPAGAVAKQHTGGMTAAYDVSSVADYWPGIDPPPVAPPPPPLPPAQNYPGDHVTRHPLNIVTDANGNGYSDLPVAFAGVVAVFANGADPQTNQHYTPIPRLSASAEGAGTRVELEGGPPAGNVLVFVAAAN